ncbi:MAG: cation transporter, partial [Huintestinicola sp.]
MLRFDVTGMSCAACSSHVEKAVKEVAGVKDCSVSLLTNSMEVDGSASPEMIIAAVEKAGYGASVKGAKTAQNDNSHAEEKVLRQRLVSSVLLLLILMYFSMGYTMW